jgi:hypothetical protein
MNMQPSTGQIYDVKDDADAEKRGLVPIPARMVEALKALAAAQRLELLERLAVHPAAGMTPAERNFAKRVRRARRPK